MLDAMKNAKSKVYKHLISKMIDGMNGDGDNGEIVDGEKKASLPDGLAQGQADDIHENHSDVGGQDENKSNVRDMLKSYMAGKPGSKGKMIVTAPKHKASGRVEVKGFKRV